MEALCAGDAFAGGAQPQLPLLKRRRKSGKFVSFEGSRQDLGSNEGNEREVERKRRGGGRTGERGDKEPFFRRD